MTKKKTHIGHRVMNAARELAAGALVWVADRVTRFFVEPVPHGTATRREENESADKET